MKALSISALAGLLLASSLLATCSHDPRRTAAEGGAGSASMDGHRSSTVVETVARSLGCECATRALYQPVQYACGDVPALPCTTFHLRDPVSAEPGEELRDQLSLVEFLSFFGVPAGPGRMELAFSLRGDLMELACFRDADSAREFSVYGRNGEGRLVYEFSATEEQVAERWIVGCDGSSPWCHWETVWDLDGDGVVDRVVRNPVDSASVASDRNRVTVLCDRDSAGIFRTRVERPGGVSLVETERQLEVSHDSNGDGTSDASWTLSVWEEVESLGLCTTRGPIP